MNSDFHLATIFTVMVVSTVLLSSPDYPGGLLEPVEFNVLQRPNQGQRLRDGTNLWELSVSAYDVHLLKLFI